eukprot:snap_masked-scaffold_12-processed-gene-7.39-mRNA-1 protein AED:0.42 eAED:0.42 QI:0/0/0/0.5/1/1/2/0/530
MFITVWIFLIQILRISYAEKYLYKDYEQILQTLTSLQDQYPNLLNVTNALKEYDIPSPGQCGASQCQIPIVTLSNFSNLKSNIPQVFFSGAVHGNERVGPSSTIYFIELMLELSQKNKWINYLLNNRLIIILPFPNALGYFENVREENRVDPNRDFPFDNPEKECLRTSAAKAIHAVFDQHLIQLSLTFHGGMKAVSYEWGDMSHRRNSVSPDDISQKSVSEVLGSFGDYPVGRLDRVVYPVRGGMEDYAYGYSWADNGKGCLNYQSAESKEEMGKFRIVNILIETSDDKEPNEEFLGSKEDTLKFALKTEDFVTNAVRMMLFATDVVQPYCVVTYIEIVDEDVIVEWDVSGGLEVTETQIELYVNGSLKGKTKLQQGVTRWHTTSPMNMLNRRKDAFINLFKDSLPAGNLGLNEGNNFEVKCKTVLDQEWGRKLENSNPNLYPQAHLSQARSNTSWQASNQGWKIQGRREFYSEAVSVVYKSNALMHTSLGRKMKIFLYFSFFLDFKSGEKERFTYQYQRQIWEIDKIG